jgi:hypothetical protein
MGAEFGIYFQENAHRQPNYVSSDSFSISKFVLSFDLAGAGLTAMGSNRVSAAVPALRTDLPRNVHPKAIRASAGFGPDSKSPWRKISVAGHDLNACYNFKPGAPADRLHRRDRREHQDGPPVVAQAVDGALR